MTISKTYIIWYLTIFVYLKIFKSDIVSVYLDRILCRCQSFDAWFCWVVENWYHYVKKNFNEYAEMCRDWNNRWHEYPMILLWTILLALCVIILLEIMICSWEMFQNQVCVLLISSRITNIGNSFSRSYVEDIYESYSTICFWIRFCM